MQPRISGCGHPTRVTAERTPTAPPVELPAITPSPTRAISSPRVLSDLFWMGRYAERAENMARLLTVTRERYHEYRYRREMEGSECVPVLLAALGKITGTDTGRRRLRRDGGDGADHAVVVDRRPAPLRLARAVGRAPRAGRARGARPDVQRHLDGVGGRRARPAARAGLAAASRRAEGDAFLSSTNNLTLAGHAGAVRRGRRIDGAGRRLDDDGHRQTHRTRPRADGVAACNPHHGPQPRRRANDHRVDAGGVRVVGHLSAAQSRHG